MARAVEDSRLLGLIEGGRGTSRARIEALGVVFDELGKRPRGKVSAAMDGLVAEAAEAIESLQSGPVLECALAASLHGILQYAAVRYGALAIWAEAARLEEAIPALETTLHSLRTDTARLVRLTPALAKAGAAG